jgi:hypothetical protein
LLFAVCEAEAVQQRTTAFPIAVVDMELQEELPMIPDAWLLVTEALRHWWLHMVRGVGPPGVAPP